MINENHLEVFKIAINDFDGMNRSDEDHESELQKLEDIYNFVDKFIKHTDVRDWEVVSNLKIIEWKCSHCKGEITFECFPIWDIESQTFDLFFDPKWDNYCGACWSPQMATAVLQEESDE